MNLSKSLTGSTGTIKKIVGILMFWAMFTIAPGALAENGLVTKSSPYPVQETLDRLQKILESKGLTIFARVDHAGGAKKAGLEMRPEQLLLFGNPKMGTPLMNSNPAAGIDLPMKALAYEDADGKVWLVYNHPAMMATRHNITDKNEVIQKMTGALNKLTDAALAK